MYRCVRYLNWLRMRILNNSTSMYIDYTFTCFSNNGNFNTPSFSTVTRIYYWGGVGTSNKMCQTTNLPTMPTQFIILMFYRHTKIWRSSTTSDFLFRRGKQSSTIQRKALQSKSKKSKASRRSKNSKKTRAKTISAQRTP